MRIRTEEQRSAFRASGFDLKGAFDSFEVAENDPRWEGVSELLKRFKVIDTSTTGYSDVELGSAAVLGVLGASPKGYPEPSGNFGYLAKTFDLTEYCDLCGIGARQVAPFRLKKVPKLQSSVLQLNWVFDELFVDGSIWRKVFEPFGIGFRPTVLHRTGVELDDLVQLDIRRAVDVNVEQLKKFKDCRRCGRRKYWPKYLGGPYPPPVVADAAIFRSKQYFGDGLLAFNLVFISNRLFHEIRSIGLRGLTFQAISRNS
jgi:hypothetical protein